jgi:hypothetical protein
MKAAARHIRLIARHSKCVRIWAALPLVLSAGFLASPALAQQAGVLDPGAQVERQRSQQLRLEEERTRRERTRAPEASSLGDAAKAAGLTIPNGGACVTIRNIHVDGTRLIAPEAIARVVEPFQGRCLDLAGLNEPVKAITLAYVEKGFVASRAYLSPQDLSGGKLMITVIEGRLEAIQFKRDGKKDATPAATPAGGSASGRDILPGTSLRSGVDPGRPTLRRSRRRCFPATCGLRRRFPDLPASRSICASWNRGSTRSTGCVRPRRRLRSRPASRRVRAFWKCARSGRSRGG